MMSAPYTLHGWHLSYYTGKVLCYLRRKRLPFELRPASLPTLFWRIRRRTGAVVMPVLQTPQGAWIQDSSSIIEQLEARHPDDAVLPDTPRQRFAASLLEAWGDECWVPVAMHTRWSHAENYRAFEAEVGPNLLPGWPAALQRRASAQVAATLRGYLPAVGVRAEQLPLLDAWTASMLDLLDTHFAAQPFLLGGRPSLGDFGLVGTMYGHLARDPWPARALIAPRPHLRAWIARMASPDPGPQAGPWLADDRIAPTLEPVLRVICREFTPMLAAILRQTRGALAQLPPGRVLPRQLGEIEYPMGDGRFRRRALPYSLWMAQRSLDLFHAMPAAGQASVRDWLAGLGGAPLLALDIPRLQRVGLRVRLQEASA